MLGLVLRRVLWMIPTLLVISFISFFLIQLPPGDYLTSYIMSLQEVGESVSMEEVAALREQYHLDDPFLVQYVRWISGFVRGDMGMSFEMRQPVSRLIGERLLLTMAIALTTLAFTWAIAIPIGVYSAVRQYSAADYTFTFLGFIGLATPPFLLALIFMYAGYELFGISAGGLFSAEYQSAPWSQDKFLDLLKHLWIPVVVIGLRETAGLIRVMRGNLLDELRKQYVLTARAKGVHPIKLLFKYPVRVAINPLISTIGWVLPNIVSSSVIVAVVLGLPTTGPYLLRSLMNQDMYLAGAMVMLLATMTVVGTLISDLLLLCLDPRIRYEQQEH